MSNPAALPYLSAERLEALDISTDDVISSIERLLRGQAKAQVWNAPKSVIQPPDGRYMMSTLSAADDPPYLAVKSLILNPRNTARGLSQINSLVTLLDSETGLPMGLVEGNWVTAVRTAGLSAVAAKYLARPDSAIAAFIGCGVQALSHLKAFADRFPLREIRAFGRGAPNRDALCGQARKMGLSAVASETAREAVHGADLVMSAVTISPDLEPFLDVAWLTPGAFATITDIGRPWHRESMPRFDRVFIDDLEQEASMPDPMVDPALVHGDLTALVNRDSVGRDAHNQRTAFVFRGLALGDLAVAALAFDRARAPE